MKGSKNSFPIPTRYQEDRTSTFSGAWWEDGTREVLTGGKEKLFHHEGNLGADQIASRLVSLHPLRFPSNLIYAMSLIYSIENILQNSRCISEAKQHRET